MNPSSKFQTNLFITSTNYTADPNDISLPDDARIGIDRVKLVVENSPLCGPMGNEWEPVPLIDKITGEQYLHYRKRFSVSHGSVVVTVRPNRNNSLIDINPSRILSTDKAALFPADALEALIKQLLLEVTSEFWPSFIEVDEFGEMQFSEGWTNQVRFKSLEVARDFLVPTHLVGPLFDVISRVEPRKGATRHKFDSGPGTATSVYHRTRSSGYDKLYNKTEELVRRGFSVNNSDDSLIRFEATLMGSRLKKFNLKTLDQVSSLKVWSAVVARFVASNFNVKLNSKDSLDKLFLKLPFSKREQLTGYLHLVESGLTEGMSKGIDYSRRRLAKSLGLVVGAPFVSESEEVYRLDIHTGRLATIGY